MYCERGVGQEGEKRRESWKVMKDEENLRKSWQALRLNVFGMSGVSDPVYFFIQMEFEGKDEEASCHGNQ